MSTRLTNKDILALGFMTFALFVGAGNIIFPPMVGLQAGPEVWWAAAGFMITAVGLPVMTVIALARVGGGVDALSTPIGRGAGDIRVPEHRHGRARQCTRRRMRWQVHGRVKVGGDLVEPRGIKLGDNVRGWALALSGRREPERERGQVRRPPTRPVQAHPKAPYVLETPAGCPPQETGRLRADHRDAAWRTFRSG